jgi:hypothetical protein
MTPEEEKAVKKAESEKRYADWVANNPDRVAEAERVAREGTDKFLEERKVMRETDPEGYAKLVGNEPSASRDPDLYFEKLKRHHIQDEMKKDAIAKKKANFEAERAAKLAARGR